jgi:SLOG family YspA-like protein
VRVLVCGSRHFEDYWKLHQELLHIHMFDPKPAPGRSNIDVIISGKAKGADTLAEDFARVYRLEFEGYPADWKKHGKAAGPIRNKQMLDEGKPDLVIAFLAPNSRGTRNMIDQAEKAGVPVKVIEI